MASPVRLGVVGAGTFSQNRMLPNFARVAGVDVLAEVESVRTRLY